MAMGEYASQNLLAKQLKCRYLSTNYFSKSCSLKGPTENETFVNFCSRKNKEGWNKLSSGIHAVYLYYIVAHLSWC
jgi:hypothetical protein